MHNHVAVIKQVKPMTLVETSKPNRGTGIAHLQVRRWPSGGL
jgi:hypothetical protein